MRFGEIKIVLVKNDAIDYTTCVTGIGGIICNLFRVTYCVLREKLDWNTPLDRDLFEAGTPSRWQQRPIGRPRRVRGHRDGGQRQ